jgi:coproporphyrinogen III oxidase
MADSTAAAAASLGNGPQAVKRYLNDLHDRITAAVEAIDTVSFRRDGWQRPPWATVPRP